ncbi:MAG: 2-C-methyl-D-erythritol 4-phosphate cytidylyltransferase [Ruminococcus sp.]|jgi:2-C-methyl-D-erythritol 4-phosphate cytidylyltransferase|nr:2-C-methyl-D-erythritol 4-phosphate cytidylyltransferase [Ruminococcus sp.]
MNFAILLAGGKGERIKGANEPKQFIKIGGKPLFAYALEAMGNCADIDVICVVTFPEKQNQISEFAAGFSEKLLFSVPGKSRQHSVLSGLEAIEENFVISETDCVIVHDAARPFVFSEDFYGCINAAKGFDGATPALSPSDTIYISENGKTITEILDRDKLFAGQTPECYNFHKYIAAFRSLTDEQILKIRGGSELAFLFGMNIRLYPGNPKNLKITSDRDLEFLKFTIENGGTI